MGLFCCTLNISANVSPLCTLSGLNLTCSGWDFSNRSHFLVQGIYQLLSICFHFF